MKRLSKGVMLTIALVSLGIAITAVYALFPEISNVPTPDSSWSSKSVYKAIYPYNSVYLNTSKSVPSGTRLAGNITLFDYAFTPGVIGQYPPRLYVYESVTFFGLRSNEPLPTPVFAQENYTYHSGEEIALLQFSFNVPSATVYYFLLFVHSGYSYGGPEAELLAITMQSTPQWWFRWLPVVGALLTAGSSVFRLPGVSEKLRELLLS